MEILTNCKNTNTEDHDGSGHQRQPAGWLAPPGFATRQSAVKTAQNQVQTKQKKTQKQLSETLVHIMYKDSSPRRNKC